jgi:phosphinothricin tripeptide acetyl hydrolase
MPFSDLESIIAGFEQMQSGWGEGTTPGKMRADFEAWCERFPDDRRASITRVSAGGVPADQIEPAGLAPSRVVLHLHGGGYSLGSARSHRALGKRIAFAARARVVLPDYRLAPEHSFPAAVEDAVASYRWLLATGAEPERIAVAGDSAGAGLALALLVSLRDAGAPLPACAVLVSPFADLGCSAESYSTLATLDPIVSREMGLAMGKLYLGDREPSDPLASPVHAKLAGLPPLLIQVGSREVVLDDARTIERHAREAGVLAKLDVWPGMVHAWHLFASALEPGQRAIEDLGSFIRQWTEE